MKSAYDLVVDLTSGNLPEADVRRALRDFSSELGWRPSYHIVVAPFVDEMAKAHLVVEHGLEPAAVLTFLSKSSPFELLQRTEQYHLFELSYNNLVDWHICIEWDKVSVYFNRTSPPKLVERGQISQTDFNRLRNDTFDQLVGRRPNPNFPALDQALINTISRWKRMLAADLGYDIPNENFSTLFNSIILVRAIEDQQRRLSSQATQVLLETATSNGVTIRKGISAALLKLVGDNVPKYLFDEDKLAVFDKLGAEAAQDLYRDFYTNRFAPYRYDFSVMSKHALSRIYEHYSSVLHIEDSPQVSFFPRVPEEEWNKTYGSIYTPQFIASFFARFVREQLPPGAFRRLKTIDPAVGSGIFLRTLLELQCDPFQDGVTSEAISQAFNNVMGLDVDENATQASRLSLALLHLALTGQLPQSLHILTSESLQYFEENPALKEAFDVVIANPPFLSLGIQSNQLRERLRDFMKDDSRGRTDMYLAFLKLGLEMLKPGGYGLFLVPHSFLMAKTAGLVREHLSNAAWIRCLADLSAIRIFGDISSYIVLLIFQKKPTGNLKAPSASVIRCQDSVGHALEDYLNGQYVDTPYYSIYEVGQEQFGGKEWFILPPAESSVMHKLASLPTLQDYADIHEGMVTGDDETFIIPKELVPEREQDIFLPFLPDREMERYRVPKDTGLRVFYPFVCGRRLAETELRSTFHNTWAYLESRRTVLEKRLTVQSGELNWWEPTRPRVPRNLLRPKIVSPHLVLVPRFSLDMRGLYAVSHGPFILPREVAPEEDLLKYLLAVLNSPICGWFLASHSHKYGRGYMMLEPKTLKQVPIPDLSDVPPSVLGRLLSLIDMYLAGRATIENDREIEQIVVDLFGLSAAEQRTLNIGD
jgi:type I restriction-modification system DNA methylase subunit